MSLSESKDILKSLQQNIIEKQLGAFIKRKHLQKLRKKGSYNVKLKILLETFHLKVRDIIAPKVRSKKYIAHSTNYYLNTLRPNFLDRHFYKFEYFKHIGYC